MDQAEGQKQPPATPAMASMTSGSRIAGAEEVAIVEGGENIHGSAPSARRWDGRGGRVAAPGWPSAAFLAPCGQRGRGLRALLAKLLGPLAFLRDVIRHAEAFACR